jgi:hypothetical protein
MQSRNYLILRQNRLFDIKIDVINADEMSDKKQHEFVRSISRRLMSKCINNNFIAIIFLKVKTN